MTKNDQIFLNRLNEHPELRERMEGLLNMVENETGNFTKANDAEQYAIDELRKMGNDILDSPYKPMQVSIILCKIGN